MGNVAVLGACVRLLAPGRRSPFLEQAVAVADGRPRGRANVVAAREGYARCTQQHTLAGDAPLEPRRPATAGRAAPLFPVSTTDSLANHTGSWSLDRPLLLDGVHRLRACARSSARRARSPRTTARW